MYAPALQLEVCSTIIAESTEKVVFVIYFRRVTLADGMGEKPPSDEGGGTAQAVTEGEKSTFFSPPFSLYG